MRSRFSYVALNVSIYRRKSKSSAAMRTLSTDKRNHPSQGPYACKTWEMFRRKSRAQKKKILCWPPSCKNTELGLAATVTNILDKEGEPQGFAAASKSEAWMDSMREELSCLINHQTWICLMICMWIRTLSAEYQRTLFMWKPHRNHINDPIRKFWWWIMPSLPFKSVPMALNNREWNATFDSRISWNPLGSKSVHKNRKMKFWFSSTLISSWLCRKQSRSTKDFEICWRMNSRSKYSGSPNTYWVSVWS